MRALALAVVLALAPASGRAPAYAKQPSGAYLYAAHCAACHGADGRGNGPDAELFSPPPADLRARLESGGRQDEMVGRLIAPQEAEVAMDPAALRARPPDADVLIAYLRGIPDIDWRTVNAGQALYIERCEGCHGRFGAAAAVLPPGVRPPRNLADPDFQRAFSDRELVAAVRHGREGMPALIPRLSDGDAHTVAAFVRVLSPGFETYSRYCAACHGDQGVGTGSFGEEQPRPTAIFDKAYFARHDTATLRRSVLHMLDAHQPSMPHFRDRLSKAQARAIVRWLAQPPPAPPGAPR